MQALLKGFDLYVVEVLPLGEHFRKRNGQAGLDGQSLRFSGLVQILSCQQSAPDRFVPQCMVIPFRIGHPAIPVAPLTQ